MNLLIGGYKNKSTNFKHNLHPTDYKYKQTLIRGVQEKYQFIPNLESLNSVLGPNELKDILSKVSFENFSLGKNSIIENIKLGIHKINLHIHTKHSDGSLTVDEYLEQSKKYADKVADISTDEIPFYVSAITDHNNVEGVQESIARIADEPKKYKNFKFVPGCEFLFNDPNSKFKFPAFEAVGLCFNPFAKEFTESLSKFNPISLINKIKEFGGILSYAHPIRYCQGNGIKSEFIDYLKSIGINGIESNYQYFFNNAHELDKSIELVKNIAKENEFWETGGTDTHSRNIFHARVGSYMNELI